MRLFSAMNGGDSMVLLQDVAHRNIPVEIQFDRGGEVHVGKSRLLAVLSDRVVIERPIFAQPSEPLASGRDVVVYFLLGGTRYAFHTEVLQERLLHDLNAGTRVPAVALILPAAVEKNQRRGNFRISLGGRHDITVRFHSAESAADHAVPIDAERFEGRLIDVSTGGLRVLIGCEQRPRFRLGERFFTAFELPTLEEPFLPLCRVCYLKNVRNGEAHQVGMQFIPWFGFVPGIEHARLHQFVTAEQRRQLQGRISL